MDECQLCDPVYHIRSQPYTRPARLPKIPVPMWSSKFPFTKDGTFCILWGNKILIRTIYNLKGVSHLVNEDLRKKFQLYFIKIYYYIFTNRITDNRQS